MEVTVAKTAGFCFGVKRAVEKVYEQIGKTEKPIYTYGPIIHNEQVVGDLQEKGVEVIDTLEELKTIRDAVVVIRSHGVGKDVYDILKENGVEIVDATCPYVKKIHRIVEQQTAEGRRVIIIGSPEHPEVQGIRGWGNDTTLVVEKPEQIDRLFSVSDIKICPDLAHLAAGGGDPLEIVKKYYDRISFVHLKDLDENGFAPLGTGHVDVEGVLRFLKEKGYAGDYLVEADGFAGDPEEACRTSYRFLQGKLI